MEGREETVRAREHRRREGNRRRGLEEESDNKKAEKGTMVTTRGECRADDRDSRPIKASSPGSRQTATKHQLGDHPPQERRQAQPVEERGETASDEVAEEQEQR
jgi:hypothetical protein